MWDQKFRRKATGLLKDGMQKTLLLYSGKGYLEKMRILPQTKTPDQATGIERWA